MQNFVIRPMAWPIRRLFSRNPLVRTSDRIEAAVIPLAAFLMVIAAVCAGLLGTMVRDIATQKYLGEAETRHAVVATAVGNSMPGVIPEPTAFKVYVRWQAKGADHADLVTWGQPVKAGAPLQIWVDADGNRVEAPTPIALAGGYAVLAGAVLWWAMILAIVLIVSTVRAHVNRMRDDQWEQEIRYLVENDGRTNRSQ
jgi:hypothetical protein